ncbi:MAG: response regulator, partial [Bdellovibrionales bacterium]
QITYACMRAIYNRNEGVCAPLITSQNVSNYVKGAEGASLSGDGRCEFPEAKVLAVEDIALNMILIKKVLSQFGVQTDTAENGAVAYDKMKQNLYDVVFMDCHMPKMDGFEATRKIREFEHDNDKSPQKIVALTADAMVGDREKCLAAGMDDYVNKPFKKSEILTMLQKWVDA